MDKPRPPHEGPRRRLAIDAVAQAAAVIADVESSELRVSDDLAIARDEAQLRRASLALPARLLAATEPVELDFAGGHRRISGHVQEANDDVVLLQCSGSPVLVQLAAVNCIRGLPQRGITPGVTLSTSAIYRRIVGRSAAVCFRSGGATLHGVVGAVAADHFDLVSDGEVCTLPFPAIARVECFAVN